MNNKVTYKKGFGIREHTHPGHYEHTVSVIKGEMKIQIGGLTTLVKAGESILHRKGVPLKGWAVSDLVILDVEHHDGR